jgi:hypothetical protein
MSPRDSDAKSWMLAGGEASIDNRLRRLLYNEGRAAGRQGQSVFHNAQELEEFSGLIAEITEGHGDFVAARQT